ncbi:MAG: Trk family potassium uptake protein [Caldiserica bacterium]|nr:Trk family potassium uptake protein [Caldisericota bacterium]
MSKKFSYIFSFLAFVSLVLEYGFPWGNRGIINLHFSQLFLAFFFIVEILALLYKGSYRKDTWKANIAEAISLFVFFILLLSFLFLLRSSHATYIVKLPHFLVQTPFFIPVQIYLALQILVKASDLPRTLVHLPLKPGQVVVVTYLGIIVLGTFLLSLPQAYGRGYIPLIDRLFTATSATCVTGLSVLDISTAFTRFGQSIILFLIQVGGLGLVTFVSFFALIMGRGIGIRERALLKDVLDYDMVGELGRVVLTVLLTTLFVEAIGTLALARVFSAYPQSVPSPYFFALFHSVSAFCNAGFSLFSNSLQDFRDSTSINLIFATLIIIGGLGFVVLMDLFKFFNRKIRKKFVVLSIHSRLVLLTTAILIFAGFVFLMWINYDSSLSLKGRILTSFFQSVTARTAGFSTIEVSKLNPAAQLFIIFLMFVGASPGSTGGGIKTSTFAVVIITIFSYLRGKDKVEVWHRTLPSGLVHKIIAVVSFAFFIIFSSTFLLLLVEGKSFLPTFFEVVSAFGTVGLSHGITSDFSFLGKIILMVTMLLGRIGPLTLALAVGPTGKKVKYAYPEEKVVVG